MSLSVNHWGKLGLIRTQSPCAENIKIILFHQATSNINLCYKNITNCVHTTGTEGTIFMHNGRLAEILGFRHGELCLILQSVLERKPTGPPNLLTFTGEDIKY